MRFYTTSRLSENMEFTPEGYLLCKGVPIARTGALEYLPEEVPDELSEGASGPVVLVYRNADELFGEATIASYEGKPVTIEHPDDFVNPENWRDLTVGHAQNVRRGEGDESGLLLADLLITDQRGIDLIIPLKPEDGGEPDEPVREVSCGYDADYERLLPGIGRQTGIIGNHIALVPHGRCGSRCAIKDKESTMAKAKRPGWWDSFWKKPAVKKAMDEAIAEGKGKDEEEPDKEEQERQTATDSPELGEKLDELLIMMRSLLDALKPKDGDTTTDNDEETGDDDPACDDEPEQTGDDDPDATADEDPEESGATKTGDARFRVADAAVIARAGRLAPSMRFRAGDSAAVVKRSSLQAAMSDAAVARLVNACLGGVPLDRAKGRVLDSAFTAAAEYMRARNNDRTGRALAGARARDGRANGPTTPAEINNINRKFRDSGRKE